MYLVESTFILELNAAKNIGDIEKYSNQKLRRIKFPTKNSVDAHLYLPHGMELGGSKDCLVLKYYNNNVLK